MYDNFIHIGDPVFAGHEAQEVGRRPTQPADATATVRPTVPAPPSESAMIEAKGYRTHLTNDEQYTRDSTIMADPFNRIHYPGSAVDSAETHMNTIKENTKTFSRAYDALHGGTGEDSTGAKYAPRVKDVR